MGLLGAICGRGGGCCGGLLSRGGGGHLPSIHLAVIHSCGSGQQDDAKHACRPVSSQQTEIAMGMTRLLLLLERKRMMDETCCIIGQTGRLSLIGTGQRWRFRWVHWILRT